MPNHTKLRNQSADRAEILTQYLSIKTDIFNLSATEDWSQLESIWLILDSRAPRYPSFKAKKTGTVLLEAANFKNSKK